MVSFNSAGVSVLWSWKSYTMVYRYHVDLARRIAKMTNFASVPSS